MITLSLFAIGAASIIISLTHSGITVSNSGVNNTILHWKSPSISQIELFLQLSWERIARVKVSSNGISITSL
jgi:hypothetical protein